MPTHQFLFSGPSIIHLLSFCMAHIHTHTHTQRDTIWTGTHLLSLHHPLFLFNKQQRTDTKLKQNQPLRLQSGIYNTHVPLRCQ